MVNGKTFPVTLHQARFYYLLFFNGNQYFTCMSGNHFIILGQQKVTLQKLSLEHCFAIFT